MQREAGEITASTSAVLPFRIRLHHEAPARCNRNCCGSNWIAGYALVGRARRADRIEPAEHTTARSKFGLNDQMSARALVLKLVEVGWHGREKRLVSTE